MMQSDQSEVSGSPDANTGAHRDAPTEAEPGDGLDGQTPDVTGRLLEAAVAEFAEHGFEAATVAQIARRAGYTTGAIYARWTGKRDLIVDAVRHVIARCMHLPSDENAAPAIDTLAGVAADLMSAEVVTARNVMVEALVSARRDDSFRAAISDSLEEAAATMRAIISRGKTEGSIDPDLDTRAMVALYQAVSLGMHLVMSSHPEVSRVPDSAWDALAARVIEAASPRTADG